jgi:hypothetical protein
VLAIVHVRSVSSGFVMPDREPEDEPKTGRFISALEYLRNLSLKTRLPFASLDEDRVVRNVTEIVSLRKGHRVR